MQVGAFDQLRDVSEGFNREICPLMQVPSSVFFARRANFGVASEPETRKVMAGKWRRVKPQASDPTTLPCHQSRDSAIPGPDAFQVFRVGNPDKVAYGWIYVHFGFPL